MESIVSFVGAFLKHIIGVLLLCWRRMLRAGLIAFAIGVVLVLLVAVIATGQAYPGPLALVIALIFGAALAYGIALTVLIEEFLLGVVDLIRLLEGDSKAVTHITAAVTEREVGEVGRGLRRLIGLPLASAAPPAAPTLPALPRSPAAPPRRAPNPARPLSATLDAAASIASIAASAASRGAAPGAPEPPASATAAPDARLPAPACAAAHGRAGARRPPPTHRLDV